MNRLQMTQQQKHKTVPMLHADYQPQYLLRFVIHSFGETKVTYFLGPWGPWALLSYADLPKHPSGPTPFPTNAPREKHIPVLVRTRAYPCTEQSRAEFSSAKFSCSEQ